MRYIIVTPTYTHCSAGIVALHELQKWLVRSGKDAMILNFSAPYHIEDDDIVVYPEIVSGNPLKAQRVVRYILNEPGKLGGDTEYDKNEILFAYDGLLAQYSNGVILAMPIIEDFFTDKGYDRTIDCFWIGKGENTNHPINISCIKITYQWPSRRRELAELLNRTKTLYSYDDCTMLLTEARLCGCDIKLIKNNDIIDLQVHPPNLELFKKQLEQFIEMTWYPEIDLNCKASESIQLSLSQKKSQDPLENGLSLKQKQRYEEALKAFSIARNMGDTSALVHMGDCLANLGRPEEAEAAYKEALRFKYDDLEAQMGMAVVKFLTKDFDTAIAIFNKVLMRDPTNSKALCGLGMARLGEGRTKIGFSYLKKSLDADPENLTSLSELVKCAYQLNSYDEAVEYVQRYLMYHPSDVDMLFSLAGVQFQMDQHTEAFDTMERLLTFDPAYQGGTELADLIGRALAGGIERRLRVAGA